MFYSLNHLNTYSLEIIFSVRLKVVCWKSSRRVVTGSRKQCNCKRREWGWLRRREKGEGSEWKCTEGSSAFLQFRSSLKILTIALISCVTQQVPDLERRSPSQHFHLPLSLPSQLVSRRISPPFLFPSPPLSHSHSVSPVFSQTHCPNHSPNSQKKKKRRNLSPSYQRPPPPPSPSSFESSRKRRYPLRCYC